MLYKNFNMKKLNLSLHLMNRQKLLNNKDLNLYLILLKINRRKLIILFLIIHKIYIITLYHPCELQIPITAPKILLGNLKSLIKVIGKICIKISFKLTKTVLLINI